MTATPVTKDQRNLIRVLSADHDLKTISELTGISYGNVRQIVSRAQRKAQKQGLSQIVTNHVETVANTIETELQQNGKETKLKLSRYARNQAEHLATRGKLKDHRAFKDLATGSAGLHGWNEQKQGQSFTLNVLNMGSLEVSVDTSEAEERPGVSR